MVVVIVDRGQSVRCLSRLCRRLVLLLVQLLLGLAGLRLRRLLLGAHKLRVVNEAVLTVVVHRQDRIDERQQLVVGEDLLLDAGLRVVVTVRLLLLAALLCPGVLVRCVVAVCDVDGRDWWRVQLVDAFVCRVFVRV